MGWKSTIWLTRQEAINAIEDAKLKAGYDDPYKHISNDQLDAMMYDLDIGDDPNLPYYGHNFIVVDKVEDKQ